MLPRSRSKRLSPIALTTLLLGIGITIFLSNTSFEMSNIPGWIIESGPFGWLAFVLLYGLLVTLCLPTTVMNLTGGALFGPYLGLLLNAIGATLGAGISFLLSRHTGQQWVHQKLSGHKFQTTMQHAEEQGWKFVAWTRLMPIFPFFVVNYLLGLTRIDFRSYVVTTFFSVLPLFFVYTSLGHQGYQLMNGQGQPRELLWLLAGIAVVATVMFGLSLMKKRGPNGSE